MKKLLLILTGGTIGSMVNNDLHRDVYSKKTAPILIDILRKSRSAYCNQEIDVIPALNTLSENMTAEKWNVLIQILRESVKLDKYGGILISHGTDTLHFTAPLVDFLMAGTNIPVIFVAADKPLSDAASNGGKNFINGVELIMNRIVKDGAWVVYQNSDRKSYLHRGTHLLQCENRTSDFFSSEKKLYSVKNTDSVVNDYNSAEISQINSIGNLSESPLINSIGDFNNSVLWINPYAGINYGLYNIKGVKAVIHGLYHSETCSSESGNKGVISFVKKCRKNNIDFYITPCHKETYDYASTKKVIDAGAKTLYKMTDNSAYIKIMISVSLGLAGDKQEEFLNKEYADEFIYE